ncbi:MAG TPA: sulfotransferase [Allosphingosinicella sp.]|nr:sulfotransferase [Allosphingosinicella sp.]
MSGRAPRPPEALVPALERLRRGDLAGARAAAESALAAEPDSLPLLSFAGLLAARSGNPGAAADHFRRVLVLEPRDMANRINLATALVATGGLDEAAEVCAVGDPDPKLLRLAGYVHQRRDRPAEAAAAYDDVVAAFPDDFESWNNLGNARAALEQTDRAIAAFERAIALRPDVIPIYLNLSEVLAKGERNEARQALMREAARRDPANADLLVELGLAESSMADHPAAERAFREAIRLSAGFTPAWLELGLLLENLNRVDDLLALLDEARERGIAEAELDLIRAWALRRQGRLEEAMALAESVPETVNPIRRAQLIAELADRLGDPDRAFDRFEEMNRASAELRPPAAGPTYRETVSAAAALLTADKVAAWTRLDLPLAPPSPIFIVGFPRSGTTLLDTLLMNLPSLHVLEEMPILLQVEKALGNEARLAKLSFAEAKRLRALYYGTLAEIAPAPVGRTIVDKHPLHMARMALVHRLFPDAGIVFVERHPCDAVLSCFMANFQLNHAMRSFVTLEEAARTYDAVFDAWTRAETLLPLQVHRIRYERMVEDLEGEMRPLLDFLGLEWDEKVLDNRAAAAKRDHIRTASYSQVTEPIYRRSAGRWERYRRQMAPVLPILAPWAELMGYEV